MSPPTASAVRLVSIGAGGGLAAARDLLRARDYRYYWFATVPWNLARWTEIVVAGWLMLQLSGSAWDVALLGFCRSAALPVLGPFAGLIADRVDRLWLVRLAQVLNVGVATTLTVLIALGAIRPWHLFAGSLLLGVSWALDWPARRALMVDLVGQRALVQSTVLDNFSMNGAKIVGPAIAGFLLYLAGGGLGYAFLLASFTASMLLFWQVQRPAVETARSAASPMADLRGGLLYVGRHQCIVGLLLVTVFMNFFVFPYIGLLAVVAQDVLHVGPVELGWLAAANGIGAVLGLPLILRFRAGGPHGWMFVLGSAGLALTTLLFAVCPWYWPALLLLIVGGVGHAGFGTMQGTILLSQSSPEMRGRALGVLTLAIGSSPLGALFMGVIAQTHGAPWAVGLSAGLGVIVVVLTAWLTPALLRAGREIEERAVAG